MYTSPFSQRAVGRGDKCDKTDGILQLEITWRSGGAKKEVGRSRKKKGEEVGSAKNEVGRVREKSEGGSERGAEGLRSSRMQNRPTCSRFIAGCRCAGRLTFF